MEKMMGTNSGGAMDALNAIEGLGGGQTAAVSEGGLAEALNMANAGLEWGSTEIELPILGINVQVRAIQGDEDTHLKTLRASGVTFIKTFNKLLFEHTTFPDNLINNVNEFETMISQPDKEMIIYALLTSSFPVLPSREFECPHCDTKKVVDLTMTDLVHSDTIVKWDNGDFREYTETVVINDYLSIKIGLPNEKNRLEIIGNQSNDKLRENLSESNQLIERIDMMTLFIKEIMVGDNIKLTDIQKEIIPFIKGLKDIKLQIQILDFEKYENIMKYYPNFYYKTSCSNSKCPEGSFTWYDVNLETEFFREVLSIYNNIR